MVDRDLSVELARLPSAREQIPNVVDRYAAFSTRLKHDLSRSENPLQSAKDAATSLWENACSDAQTQALDDRSLYWGRLSLYETLFEHRLEALVPNVELRSRNFGLNSPSTEPQAIITGFDPFGLNATFQQCNPSGAFALALNGRKMGSLRVKSMIFPVRYADFDAFCIENALEPLLKSESTALIVTVSMGRAGFDFERFPAKCRGATQPDNQDINITQFANPFDPPLDGPSFVEFSLPVEEALQKMSSESPRRITDNRRVATTEDGTFEASSLSVLEGKHATSGSGGNFLSNEISYRTLNLQAKLGTQVPMGHVHVPRIPGYDEHQVRQDFGLFQEILAALTSLVATSPQSSA